MAASIKVKICGLLDVQSALVAAESGADYTGFVFVEGVRRQLQPEQGAAIVKEFRGLASERGTVMPKAVGLFRDQDPGWVNDVASEAGLDMVQLCGDEDEAYCAQMRLPIIKQVRIRPDASATEIAGAVDPMTDGGQMVVLDRHDEKVPGGAGVPWEWSITRAVAQREGVLLAGGLTPANVGPMARNISPWGVDVSSGVETDGVKDHAKIRSFIAAVRPA